jgi:ferrous iron transport protein A
MTEGKVLPLSSVESGQSVVINQLAGGRALRQRLLGLGLNRGIEARVMKNDGRGPLILAVGNGRVALGRGMAMKIMVNA